MAARLLKVDVGVFEFGTAKFPLFDQAGEVVPALECTVIPSGSTDVTGASPSMYLPAKARTS